MLNQINLDDALSNLDKSTQDLREAIGKEYALIANINETLPLEPVDDFDDIDISHIYFS